MTIEEALQSDKDVRLSCKQTKRWLFWNALDNLWEVWEIWGPARTSRRVLVSSDINESLLALLR